jgi:hypothetical protein
MRLKSGIDRIIASGVAVLLLGAAACGEDGVGPDGAGQEIEAFFESLPNWSEFAPSQSDQAPTPIGEPVALPDDTLNVSQIQEDGSVEVIPNVIYQCTETPYSVRKNPQQIVMYNPDVEILWPGSLIQGRSHRDGRGALLGLTIAERNPIRVSIPSIPSGQNFREVPSPNQANVGSAIGEMLGDATAQNLSTPSAITFRQTVTYSETQMALSMEVSGHYMGFSGAASADFSRNAAQTTVTAHFYQRMFEVVVAPPQTPSAFFSSDFTSARLQQQVSLGRMGPDNLPVYVSNIVYGRMMTFSITSTASEQEIRGTIQAAYNGIGGSVSGSLSARQLTILEESTIAVTSLGGDADATLAVIRSGDWSQYFTDAAPLSSAAPLSYTFRNLSDGSIASVTEAAEYNLRQCTPRPSTPGLFDFASLQSEAMGIPTPVRTRVADVNGDGRMDLIWNHAGATNQVVVGLSNGDGTFTITSPVSHPESPAEGWANYQTVVGDFNGDGHADLAWVYTGTQGNKVYFGFGNGNGTFGTPSVRILHNGNWSGVTAYAGDATADGNDDLIFNILTATANHTYVAVSDGAGQLTLGSVQVHPIGGNWTPFTTFVGDLNGNGRADIAWARANRSYMATSNGNGTLAFNSTAYDPPGVSGTARVRVAGDVDGDGRMDLIWADTTASSDNPVIVGRSTGSGIGFGSTQNATLQSGSSLVVRAGDLNGDGRTDLFWNTEGAVNRVYASLGRANGTFDFATASQLHPVTTDWDQFSVFLADVNGNGRTDVIWNHAASENRIYVAISRREP